MWRVELFGEVRVVGHGQTITRFESKRVAALLAYLVLHPQTRHPREVLADRIWPDATVEAGRNRFKQALASLRRQLEPPPVEAGSVLDADRLTIGINPDSITCDVHEFKKLVRARQWESARQLRRGEFLAGFYDDWIEDFRVDLDAYVLELDLSEDPSEIPAARPEKEHRKSIPAASSTFIGREPELAAIKEALTKGRWLTITGFGGLGKTRLSRQVGRAWDGDAFFVPLASAQDASAIPSAILNALGLDGAQVSEPIRALAEATAGRQTLLILDNLEQLHAPDLSMLFTRLLEECPDLSLLCTSRIAIRASLEHEIRLDPLPVPAQSSDPAELIKNPSVCLFVDRARQSRPDFQVTASNAEAVAKLCFRLDGSPLAIEVCAAWAKMGAGTLLERLEQGAELPVRKGEAGSPHESLTRVFDTTCDLLSPAALDLLREVRVFRGGWEWGLLEQLSPEAPSFEALTELVEASVVRTDDRRFYLLESIRQQADRLGSDFTDTDQRFVALFRTLAAQSRRTEAVPALKIENQIDWIAFLDRNWTNVRHAIELSQPALAAEIAYNTEWYWAFYQADPEILRALASLDQPLANLLTTTHAKGKLPEADLFSAYDRIPGFEGEVFLRKAKLRILRQNMTGVRDLAEQAVQIFERANEPVGLGQAHHVLANCAIQEKDEREVAERLDLAQSSFERAGSQVDLAAVAYTRARARYMRADYEGALPLLYRCRDAARELRHMRTSGRIANLFGVVLGLLGDQRRARLYYYLSLIAAFRNYDARSAHMPLWNLSLSFGREGKYEPGTPLQSYSIRLWDDYYKVALDAEESALHDEFVSGARKALGIVEFAHLTAQGESFTLPDSVAFSRSALEEELAAFRTEAQSFFEPDFDPLADSLR